MACFFELSSNKMMHGTASVAATTAIDDYSPHRRPHSWVYLVRYFFLKVKRIID